MARTIDADYLVVGAGAAGMAFTDALIDHADVRVALVDRRHSVGGHWLEAYPFVRLHQASLLYGVASTVLGSGRLQQDGPEKGLHERASQPEICRYYELVLDRMLRSGKVEWFPSSEYVGDRTIVSRLSGERLTVPEHCRVVDGRYLSPSIPAETPPPFAVSPDAHVIPVNDLPSIGGRADDADADIGGRADEAQPSRVETTPSQYVIAGSGKTATDAIIWLLARGVDPDAIGWVRPRDPWMFNRAKIQPNPEIFLGMAADMMQAAAAADSLDDLFLRLEDAGIMLRVDRSVTPTMAKTPTLATWELEKLRTVENVVRRGHIESVDRGKLTFADGAVAIADDAVVVHCAASGLKYPPLVPVWQPDAIRVQPIRTGFPCFGAALIGYVEATRDDDAEKNRLCQPSNYGNTRQDWARMTVLGTKSAMTFSSEPDIRAWANQVALNPARIPPDQPRSEALDGVMERLAAYTPPGLARLSALM